NIANANTTRGANGMPYVRQVVTLGERTPQASFQDTLSGELGQAPSAGVRVVSIQNDPTPFKLVFDPNHPDAIKDPASPMYGYVRMPNVDISAEMVDMISASRSYEANVTALNASKSMAMKALEIGK
ncbi:MAG: flagellar basal body rod protein FlgC, partial [Tumebacillaceae bacterium]